MKLTLNIVMLLLFELFDLVILVILSLSKVPVGCGATVAAFALACPGGVYASPRTDDSITEN